MLEWGSGHSTLWYSQFVRHYYSIEHHKEWYTTVQSKLREYNYSNVEHKMSHVPDGYMGWAGGFEEGTGEQFKDYVEAVSSFGVKKFDRVLIDGRARADCAKIILPYLKPESVVFVHDYHEREYYHKVVSDNYDEIGCINVGQSLVVLRPNPTPKPTAF